MHVDNMHQWQHSHDYLDNQQIETGQRRVFYVLALTTVTMVVEIVAGTLFNSMALVADGWHMASHSAALAITLFAYWYAKKNAAEKRFSFGTGKVTVLGGYSSALLLGVVALMMIWESVHRIITPLPISFDQAIVVAGIGLVVNLASVWLLHGDGHHGHDHGHDHAHDHHQAHSHSHDHVHDHHDHHNHAQDHNLRAAYLHVMADVLTSVLAIVALVCGKMMGWTWMDPIMGIVGALVITKWAYGLLRDTSSVLLDGNTDDSLASAIQTDIEADADNRVCDLHIWQLAPGKWAGVVAVVTHFPQDPAHYKALLAHHTQLSHVNIEVHHCQGESCL
ncbi:CDF family Co(II)/Ni(II) efflux transporter DmeF [Magnetovibrio sp. PR-2]|uniref:CDF family Co(II)/Ni(II) efflux transporter DmeF n=1 Tax=Magnetovibrio sp. PR-2 TaxID=3120356 RepID=UPI002FCE0B27